MTTTLQQRITKRVEFCAAHSIKGAGRCANKHGHNWVATIVVDQIAGDLDEQGFITDVRKLKDAAFRYDHDDLDQYFEYASTENVAQKIADDSLSICKSNNPSGIFIVNVHLAETANNSADVSASNFKTSPLVETVDKALTDQMKSAFDAETAYEFGGGQVPPVQEAKKFVRRTSS